MCFSCSESQLGEEDHGKVISLLLKIHLEQKQEDLGSSDESPILYLKGKINFFWIKLKDFTQPDLTIDKYAVVCLME